MKSIKIQLDEKFRPVTQEVIDNTRQYVSLREKTADELSSLIEELLKQAAEAITIACYKYDIDPETFVISSTYDEKLFAEISDILDELEDDILDLVLEYSLKCTSKEKNRNNILPWLLTLGRDNKNLQQTLENRLWSFSRDVEALIVAMKLAKRKETEAISRIKSNLHTVYITPEVKAAMKNPNVQATYIRTKGIKKGNQGNSNSEANNLERFGVITTQMAWMRNLRLDYEEEGAEGFYVIRTTNYDCPLCDSHVGFHKLTETEHFPPFHGSCQCLPIPIYIKEEIKSE